jgi:hypothetical protein
VGVDDGDDNVDSLTDFKEDQHGGEMIIARLPKVADAFNTFLAI